MRLFFLSFAIAMYGACLGPTEIHLVLTSDVCDRIRFTPGVQIYVTTRDKIDDETIPARTSAMSCKGKYIGDLFLVPTENRETLGIRIVADVDDASPCTKADNYKGCIVSRRIASFIPHERLELPISLDASCIGIECTPTTTCKQGQCVDANEPPLRDAGIDVQPMKDVNVPDVAVVHTVDWVSAGGQSTCMRINTGDIYCWGSNALGQLTITNANATTPTPAPMLQGFNALDMFVTHACGVSANSTPMCWGTNSSGQLGDGTTTLRFIPKAILAPPMTAKVVQTGQSFSCLLEGANNNTWCFGANLNGEIGLGMAGGMYPKPQALSGGQLAANALSVGSNHSCVITPAKTVFCWGGNPDGRCGVNPSTPTTNPVSTTLANVSAIAAGADHTCAIANTITSCFGSNASGQLGVNPGNLGATEKPQTIQLGMGVFATAITAGYQFSCALVGQAPTSEIACWGKGDTGQLGGGNAILAQPTPVKPNLPKGMIGITSGLAHTCAWTKSAVYCWGENSQGQIGNGTTKDVLVPTSVPIP